MRVSTGTLWNRRLLIVVLLVASLFSLAQAGMAQDPEPGEQPPRPSDLPPISEEVPSFEVPVQTLEMPETRDYSAICQNMANSAPSDVARPVLQSGTEITSYNLLNGEVAVKADIYLPPGALVTMTGYEGWLGVTEGAVAVVSCNAPLIFDITRGDDTQFSLPAGTALIVDTSLPGGVFLSLNEMSDWAWIMQIGHGAVSSVSLEMQIGSSSDLICDRLGCWTTQHISTQVAAPVVDDGTVTGGGPCAAIRCWGK